MSPNCNICIYSLCYIIFIILNNSITTIIIMTIILNKKRGNFNFNGKKKHIKYLGTNGSYKKSCPKPVSNSRDSLEQLHLPLQNSISSMSQGQMAKLLLVKKIFSVLSPFISTMDVGLDGFSVHNIMSIYIH